MYVPLEDRGCDDLERHEAALAAVERTLQDVRSKMQLLALAVGTVSCVLLSLAWYDGLPPERQGPVSRQVELASIPVVALFFTWFHIWLAIQMMFRPLKFFGIWQFGDTGVGIGWQGVVPRKALKMAKTAYSCARPYLLGPRDWLRRVDPHLLAAKTRPQLTRVVSAALATILRRHFPEFDRRLPPAVREELTASAVERIVASCPELWEQIADILCDKDKGIDNDGMIVTIFTENKALLNTFFLALGEKEFRFIERCGAALGFCCGVIQLFAYKHLDDTGRAIFLPLTGFFLGIVTNWLAIQMCFKPCHPQPVHIFGRHVGDIQGLFLKRQPDVAILYSKMLCDHFFDFDKVIAYLQTRPELWDWLKSAYLAHNTTVLRQTLGGAGLFLAPLALGQREFAAIEEDLKVAMAERFAEARDMHKVAGNYIKAATDIFRSNAKAMKEMPPDEFENLLHPVFQEDEWILILLGGILGAIVGLAQVHFLKE